MYLALKNQAKSSKSFNLQTKIAYCNLTVLRNTVFLINLMKNEKGKNNKEVTKFIF